MNVSGQVWRVHCSGGVAELSQGTRWRDILTGSEWEVVEPTGERIYSPSGLGGTPCFWCRHVSGDVPSQWRSEARADGCISFCGDSIGGGVLRQEKP